MTKRVVEDMDECGYSGSSMITRCDRESLIVDLQTEIGRNRGGVTIPTHSAVGDSIGNGTIENGVHRFLNQLR